MSPFITKGVLSQVLPKNISATIITSWKPDFIIKTPEAIDVYQECKERTDTALYLNSRLHAKLYARDLTQKNNSAIIGSANLTRKGVGLDSKPNYEVLSKLENLSTKDRIYFQRILNNSTLVTDEICQKHKEWIKENATSGQTKLEPILKHPPEKQYLVTDLPLTDSPSRLWDLKSSFVEFNWWEEDSLIHDLSIFGGENATLKEQFFDEIREGFSKQAFLNEFLKNIDKEGMFFGRIKEWVQNSCQDVPKPKRRELTITVQALLKWITELYPKEYEVIRPKHSECLRSKT